MDKNKRRRSIIAILIVVIIVTTSFSIFFASQLLKPLPAYEVKGGTTHPRVILDLMKRGTVVIFLTSDGCGESCDNIAQKIADLQSQYKGTNVVFATFSSSSNETSQSIFRNYEIHFVPAVLVISRDGAVVKFERYVDMNNVKSAIEDVRQ